VAYYFQLKNVKVLFICIAILYITAFENWGFRKNGQKSGWIINNSAIHCPILLKFGTMVPWQSMEAWEW